MRDPLPGPDLAPRTGPRGRTDADALASNSSTLAALETLARAPKPDIGPLVANLRAFCGIASMHPDLVGPPGGAGVRDAVQTMQQHVFVTSLRVDAEFRAAVQNQALNALQLLAEAHPKEFSGAWGKLLATGGHGGLLGLAAAPATAVAALTLLASMLANGRAFLALAGKFDTVRSSGAQAFTSLSESVAVFTDALFSGLAATLRAVGPAYPAGAPLARAVCLLVQHASYRNLDPLRPAELAGALLERLSGNSPVPLDGAMDALRHLFASAPATAAGLDQSAPERVLGLAADSKQGAAVRIAALRLFSAWLLAQWTPELAALETAVDARIWRPLLGLAATPGADALQDEAANLLVAWLSHSPAGPVPVVCVSHVQGLLQDTQPPSLQAIGCDAVAALHQRSFEGLTPQQRTWFAASVLRRASDTSETVAAAACRALGVLVGPPADALPADSTWLLRVALAVSPAAAGDSTSGATAPLITAGSDASIATGDAGLRIRACWALANVWDAVASHSALPEDACDHLGATALRARLNDPPGKNDSLELSKCLAAALAAAQESEKCRASAVRAAGSLVSVAEKHTLDNLAAAGLLDAALRQALRSAETGPLKTRWNALHALSRMLQNASLELDPAVAELVVGTIGRVARTSRNYKVRIHAVLAGAAIALPASRGVLKPKERCARVLGRLAAAGVPFAVLHDLLSALFAAYSDPAAAPLGDARAQAHYREQLRSEAAAAAVELCDALALFGDSRGNASLASVLLVDRALDTSATLAAQRALADVAAVWGQFQASASGSAS